MVQIDRKNIFQRVFKIGILVFFSLLLGHQSVKGQEDFKAVAEIDSAQIVIGKQVHISLRLLQPVGAKVAFPLFTDTLVNKVEILSESGVDTTDLNNSRLELKKEYIVTSFDSGLYYIPPFKFDIHPESGGGHIESNHLALNVITMDVDTAQAIFDIKTPYQVPYTFWEIAPYIGGGILFAALVLIAIYLFRRLRRSEPIIPKRVKIKDPPHVVALKELERIKGAKLWQSHKEKEYYTQLTETLREYIEERYCVPALEQTSEEILYALTRDDEIDKSSLTNLDQVLKLSDLVKFARFHPLPDENELSMINSVFFVEQTKQMEVKSLEETREEIRQKQG